MAGRIGLDFKLFYNPDYEGDGSDSPGGAESVDWVELTNVRDVNAPLEKGEADISTRGTGKWRALRGTLKTGSLDFQMIYNPEDDGFAFMQSAFLDDKLVDVADVDDNGDGVRIIGEVFNFSRAEPLEEGATVDVSIKPSIAPEAVSGIGMDTA